MGSFSLNILKTFAFKLSAWNLDVSSDFSHKFLVSCTRDECECHLCEVEKDEGGSDHNLFSFFFINIKYFVSDQCGLTVVWNDSRVNTCVSMFFVCTMYMRLLLYPSETISTYQFMMRCIGYPTLSIVQEIIPHFLYFCTHAQQHQFLKTQNILCSHFHRETMWKKSP